MKVVFNRLLGVESHFSVPHPETRLSQAQGPPEAEIEDLMTHLSHPRASWSLGSPELSGAELRAVARERRSTWPSQKAEKCLLLLGAAGMFWFVGAHLALALGSVSFAGYCTSMVLSLGVYVSSLAAGQFWLGPAVCAPEGVKRRSRPRLSVRRRAPWRELSGFLEHGV